MTDEPLTDVSADRAAAAAVAAARAGVLAGNVRSDQGTSTSATTDYDQASLLET